MVSCLYIWTSCRFHLLSLSATKRNLFYSRWKGFFFSTIKFITRTNKKLLWWRVRATLIGGYNDPYVAHSWWLHFFRKGAVLGSLPGLTVSWATGSWLGVQYQTQIPSYWAGLKFNLEFVGYSQYIGASNAPSDIACHPDSLLVHVLHKSVRILPAFLLQQLV